MVVFLNTFGVPEKRSSSVFVISKNGRWNSHNVIRTSKEKGKNEDKKLVEDQSPTRNQIPSESNSNNASRGKKKSKLKTKTEGHQAKSADIKQYFQRIS